MEEFEPEELKGTPSMISASSIIIPTNYHDAFLQTLKIFVPAGIGLIMIMFGLTTTGSYYMESSRFAGILADIWYGWQAGTFLAMIGTILIYDAVKRTGYL